LYAHGHPDVAAALVAIVEPQIVAIGQWREVFLTDTKRYSRAHVG
jgi:hypothetical protein